MDLNIHMTIEKTFYECFELAEGRTRAEQIYRTLRLAGCRASDKSIYTWLDTHFAEHERVRKIRPKGYRVWLGIKPRLQLERCECCGALSKLRHAASA